MQQLVDNRYQIGKALGSGGMADVFLAHDKILDRDVALKIMSVRYADDEEFVERFRREAQSAAALSHPHIVSIYDRGESEDGTYYIAMEYLSGGTLKDRITRGGALPPKTAVAVALQIAEALRAAHNRGVIHRDIKPHNILITEAGDVKVTDFGIARAASSSTMTRTGLILGTAHYISPEQAMGEPVGPASDIYSLGIVLYEMLTGELPYDAETPIGIAMKHVNGRLRPPKDLNPAVPESINAVTCRMLAKDPEDRYVSAAQLIEDLERTGGGREPVEATTRIMSRVPPAQRTMVGPPPPPEGDRTKRRGRGSLPWLLLLLLLLPLLAGLGWYGYGLLGDQPQSQARQAPPEQRPATLPVPDLVGMKLAEAQREHGDDFEIRVDDKLEGEQAPDTIVSQDPESGEAQKGSEISVDIVGTQVAGVPDVRGAERAAAEQILQSAGFTVDVDEEESTAEQDGLVTEQDPSGGESAEVDSEVRITVGTGPETVEVPDIPYGYTEEQSRAVLEQADLQLGSVTTAPNSDIAEGGIIDQNPAPGAEVEPGSAVDITLSSGPPQVEVPNVVGLDYNAAAQRIESAGLSPTLVEVESSEAAGTVIATDPGAGVPLDPLSEVVVSYSSGPPEPAPEKPPRAEPQPQPGPQPQPRPVPDDDNSGPGGGNSGPGGGEDPEGRGSGEGGEGQSGRAEPATDDGLNLKGLASLF